MLATKACTTCSIQMIETPPRLMSPMRVDQHLALALGQTAGNFVEQEHARVRRQRAGEFEPLAIDRA